MANKLKDDILNGVDEQISDLRPVLENEAAIAAVRAEVDQLTSLLLGFPADVAINNALKSIAQQIDDIQSGKATLSDFGTVLVHLYGARQLIANATTNWIAAQKATTADADGVLGIVLDMIGRVRQLLNYRPDVGAVMDDLAAVKHLTGGPADAEAFHDFQVLQVAFKSVWLHAFDANLKSAVEQLYGETVRLYEDAGIPMPNFDAINDIDQLQAFINEIQLSIDPNSQQPTVAPPTLEVIKDLPEAVTVWGLLSDEQRALITSDATAIEYHRAHESEDQFAKDSYVDQIKQEVADIIKHPMGGASRLTTLIAEIGEYLSEPYAFDVFAPDSYNFGLMITYRQKWEPGEYQAGDLVATIPLAPSETRKYSKKRTVKTTRAQKEIEKSMSSRSAQSTETSRAEADIMQKASTATNFKLTAHGSFNIGIGSIDATSEFSNSQDLQSSQSKKSFHEATLKSAEEYRLERSLEIDTTHAVETEESTSGEISNPNNEITVTYLFYELQRRYQIREFLYRVRPVVLIAQEVPAPHEIDEAWLIEYQWIIARVLLDDSLRPALDYLQSGFAGDETSVEIIKAQWSYQVDATKSLEGQVDDLRSKRDDLRESLISTQKQEDDVKSAEMSTAVAVFTLGLGKDPATMAADQLEASRKAFETRLGYTEQSLVDAQDKLKQASDSLRQATKEYATAIQTQYARHVAIDQLRAHVKQNILYYMQAIWDHEPTDQRFFRLYNKKIACPSPAIGCTPGYNAKTTKLSDSTQTLHQIVIDKLCQPTLTVGGDDHDLVEMADLDNPLGYKGNYIIFPLKDECYLTTYMLTDFIDNYLGVRDPDGSDDFDWDTFDQEWNAAVAGRNIGLQDKLRKQLTDYVTSVRRSTDEIIVPTGQLFIEALPGAHPLLEDFKLLHRFEDVRKVRAEVRHAELENLRLAARLAASQDIPQLLEDPDIEKKVVVDKDTSVIVGAG